MAITLATVIESLDKTGRITSEVLKKLPMLLTEEGDVPFDLGGVDPTIVPSILKLQAAMETGGLGELRGRTESLDATIRGIILQLGRVASKVGISPNTPFATNLDMTLENKDSNSGDPLYRASVDDGVHFPFDARINNKVVRQLSSEGVEIGGHLMPKFTPVIDKRWTLASSYVDVSSYAAFYRYVTRTVWYYYRNYYGYYWYWRYYYSGYYPYTYTYKVAGKPLEGSMVAQTFQVDKPRVVIGFDFKVAYPGRDRVAAKPSLILVETAYGMPDLDNVICEGVFREDAALSNTGILEGVHVDLEHPVLLEANKSYAFIIKSSAKWLQCYSLNQDSRGGTFYTQDGKFWTSDLKKDLAYSFVFADFGSNSSHVIKLNNLSVPGGIASVSIKKLIQESSETNFKIEILLGEVWQEISILNELSNLPAYVEVRSVFNGNKDVMPIVNSQVSEIVAFRPADKLKFISREFKAIGQKTLKMSYELTGFNELYHKFLPKVSEGNNIINPLTMTSQASTDGVVTTVDATFKLEGTSGFSIIVDAETLVATQLFDVSGIMILKN
ncbi:MAG: hypothetical protein Q9M50_14145 [Methylococcales bacterium]|nr:hypothetical protein [Methylococcales bacterium]